MIKGLLLTLIGVIVITIAQVVFNWPQFAGMSLSMLWGVGASLEAHNRGWY